VLLGRRRRTLGRWPDRNARSQGRGGRRFCSIRTGRGPPPLTPTGLCRKVGPARNTAHPFRYALPLLTQTHRGIRKVGPDDETGRKKPLSFVPPSCVIDPARFGRVSGSGRRWSGRKGATIRGSRLYRRGESCVAILARLSVKRKGRKQVSLCRRRGQSNEHSDRAARRWPFVATGNDILQ